MELHLSTLKISTFRKTPILLELIIFIIITNLSVPLFAQNLLTPFSILTFNIDNLDDNIAIPRDIIDLLAEEGQINNLDKNTDGDYVGILLGIAQDSSDTVIKNFKLKGNITIYDRECNHYTLKDNMTWDSVHNGLIYIWSAKDEYGNYVSPDLYNCIMEFQEVTLLYPNGEGPKMTKRTQVGVVGSGSSACGGCGTSAELAFIPPFGFYIASKIKKRKKV